MTRVVFLAKAVFIVLISGAFLIGLVSYGWGHTVPVGPVHAPPVIPEDTQKIPGQAGGAEFHPHDIVLREIVARPTTPGTLEVRVAVENRGTAFASFYVILTDETTAAKIGRRFVTLQPGASRVVRFIWHTVSEPVTRTLTATIAVPELATWVEHAARSAVVRVEGAVLAAPAPDIQPVPAPQPVAMPQPADGAEGRAPNPEPGIQIMPPAPAVVRVPSLTPQAAAVGDAARVLPSTSQSRPVQAEVPTGLTVPVVRPESAARMVPPSPQVPVVSTSAEVLRSPFGQERSLSQSLPSAQDRDEVLGPAPARQGDSQGSPTRNGAAPVYYVILGGLLGAALLALMIGIYRAHPPLRRGAI